MMVMKNETASTANARQRCTWGTGSVVIVTFSCICLVGDGRRAQSPPLEVVIRRKAAIHRPQRKPNPGQSAHAPRLEGGGAAGGWLRWVARGSGRAGGRG